MPPTLGQIAAFGGDFDTRDWRACDGRLLPISEHDVLFAVIGTTYGGDGQETFALPNLPDVVPGMRSVIAVYGEFPRERMPPWAPNVVGFAAKWKGEPPEGTVRATGQLLRIRDNSPLFSIVGERFGGSVKADTFALPKLGAEWVFCTQGVFPLRE